MYIRILDPMRTMHNNTDQLSTTLCAFTLLNLSFDNTNQIFYGAFIVVEIVIRKFYFYTIRLILVTCQLVYLN